MGRLTQAQREEKAQEAVQMSAKGLSFTAIGEAIGISRQTAKNLIDDELAKRAEHRGPGKEASIARNLAVIRTAWDGVETCDAGSNAQVGYLNTIIKAGERIDKVSGAEAPVKHQRVDQEIVVEWEDLDGAFTDES